MTDKVVKIIAHIKKIAGGINPFLPNEDGKNSDYESGRLAMAMEILQYVVRLQEEPVSEELEEAIDTYLANYFGGEKEKQDWPFLKKMAIHFAKWQKQKDEHLIWQTSSANWEKGIEEGKKLMMESAVEAEVKWVVKSALQNKLSDIKGDNMYRVEEIKEFLQSIFDANYAMVRINGDFKNGEKLKIIVLKENDMNALRKKDNHFFELAEYAYDKDGYEYKWDELILCPLEGEEVNYRMSQEKVEELRERYAGMAMQAIISDRVAMERMFAELQRRGDEEGVEMNKVVAERAVEFADALIECLKK